MVYNKQVAILKETVMYGDQFPGLISIVTHNISIVELCELSPGMVNMINNDFNINLTLPTFYFNRLKATVYRKGEGSLLMNRLIEICKEKSFCIYCEINAYNDTIINLNELIKFYTMFGMKHIRRNIMIYTFHNCDPMNRYDVCQKTHDDALRRGKDGN